MPLMNGNQFHVRKELKIVNIESYFMAFLIGFTLADQGVSLGLSMLAGLAVIVIIRMLFRFKLGYYFISIVFSAFWGFGFSSGWLRDGSWLVGSLVGLAVFAACLYGHKVNYEDNQDPGDTA